MKKKRLWLCFAAAALMSAVTGCGGEVTADPQTASAVPSQTQAKSQTEFSYPMAPGDKLTYWAELQGTVSPNFANLGDTPFAKVWMSKTGVDIEFMHPPAGQAKEQFSLILADGSLPDLMEYNWINDYPGGPEKAIKDGVILPLNDIFDQYCPNITKYLAENPAIDKMIKTDEGHYYVFPFIRGDEKLCSTMGPMLRKDWLDELNLQVPTTIDEWHKVLTQFKEKKGAAAPWCPEYTRNDFKDNYKKVFDNPMILKGYGNTMFILIVGVTLDIIMTSLGAYFLSRKQVMFKRIIMMLIIFTMFFSGGMIPFYLNMKDFHLTNSLWGLIVPFMVNTYNLVILRTSFDSIPESLIEAAKIDGAGHVTILTSIVLPLSKAILAVMVLYYGVGIWNAWFWASATIRTRELYPLQVILREILMQNDVSSMTTGVGMIDQEAVGMSIKYATIMVATIPILCVYPFLQRHFTKGTMVGAVKE